MKPSLIIIAAPSGAGKNTFINRMIKDYPGKIVHSVSYTTRKERPGEVNGNPYFFIGNTEFEEKIQDGFFVEWEKVHENYYGTSRLQLENRWAEGQWVVMDVDVKGATNLKNMYPDSCTIFILPPSISALRQRLLSRPGKTDDVELRLENAVDEMLSAPSFDYQITNDDFERAYLEFKKVIDNLII